MNLPDRRSLPPMGATEFAIEKAFQPGHQRLLDSMGVGELAAFGQRVGAGAQRLQAASVGTDHGYSPCRLL